MPPRLLALIPLVDSAHTQIAAHFDLIYVPDATQHDAAIAEHGATVQAVLSRGTTGLTAAQIARLPKLTFVAAFGAGYEAIDVDAAKARNITVVNGAGANADCVADHAMALLLAVVRDVPKRDAITRAGTYRDALPMRPVISGKKLGIVGLGIIGQKIARRAAGFDIETGYHNRKPREGATSRYFDDLLALAAWSDFLVVATPGGPGTKHLINRPVLDALGPKGFLVNIARGSVVDTQALADALAAGTLAGAGLDVYESEPEPPQLLLPLDNVVLTPHVAGNSPESREAATQLFIENATRHFSGQAVLTPV